MHDGKCFWCDATFARVINSYVTSCTVRMHSTEDFDTDKRINKRFVRLLVNRSLYYG